MFRCLGIQQEMQGDAKPGLAGVQGGVRLHIAGRDIVQHDDIVAGFLIAERQFPGDGRFEHFMLACICSIRDTRSETTEL